MVSGDTTYLANLTQHACVVDLLVHEALATRLTERIAAAVESTSNNRTAKVLRDVPSCRPATRLRWRQRTSRPSLVRNRCCSTTSFRRYRRPRLSESSSAASPMSKTARSHWVKMARSFPCCWRDANATVTGLAGAERNASSAVHSMVLRCR